MDSTSKSFLSCRDLVDSSFVARSRLNVQCDWNEVLRVAGEKAWISCSMPDQPSLYGEVFAHEQDYDGSEWNTALEASEGFEVEALGKRTLLLSHPERQCKATFVAPTTVFSQVHKKNIQCIDMSPGGALGVSSGANGELRVWQASDGKIRQQLEGHLSDVTTCKFFPSGQVVLSGGADLRLKIWSAEDGSCPVTLKGHTGGIADTAIVDKGRNVVSCARDGSARLWDCGEAKCLSVIARCECPVNSCALGLPPEQMDVGTSNTDKGEQEVGTEGKLLVLAAEDGTLRGVCLHSKKKVFTTQCSSPLNCCTFISDVNIVAGSDDGKLYHWDCRNINSPLCVLQRSRSPVLSVISDGVNRFFASTADGTCFRWNTKDSLAENGAVETLELVGPDCDPVYSVCAHAHTVYTACRDGGIRKYVLPS